MVPTVSGVVSNWGGFPADFVVNGETVSYATLMRKYFGIRNILLNGIKLKETQRTTTTRIYTNSIKEWDTNTSAYTVCDVSKFGVNARKLYYIRKSTKLTAETDFDTVAETCEVGDICYYGDVYKVYYGYELINDVKVHHWEPIKNQVVLTNRLSDYIHFGGSDTRELAENVIGVYIIRNELKAERTPDFLYYTQIPT